MNNLSHMNYRSLTLNGRMISLKSGIRLEKDSWVLAHSTIRRIHKKFIIKFDKQKIIERKDYF